MLRVSAESLTPYATEFRYPGDTFEPEKDDVEEALEMAESVLSTISQVIQAS